MIDEAVFNTLKARMKTRFPTLIEGYLRDGKKYLQTIEQNIPNNLPPVIEAAHSLKSASGLLGVVDVHEAAKEIEYQGKNGETEMLKTSHKRLKQSFAGVQPILKSQV